MVTLIDEEKSYLLPKWPVQQRIVVTLHYYDVQRQMRRFTAVPALKIR